MEEDIKPGQAVHGTCAIGGQTEEFVGYVYDTNLGAPGGCLMVAIALKSGGTMHINIAAFTDIKKLELH